MIDGRCVALAGFVESHLCGNWCLMVPLMWFCLDSEEKDPASCSVHGKAYWINLAGAFIGTVGVA